MQLPGLTPLGCEQADPNCMPPSTPRSSLVKLRGSCTQDEVGMTRCHHLPDPPPGAFSTLGFQGAELGLSP